MTATACAGCEHGKAKSIGCRKRRLLQFACLLQDNRERFDEAVKSDLCRSPPENEMCAKFCQATNPRLIGSRPSYHSRRSNKASMMSKNEQLRSPPLFDRPEDTQGGEGRCPHLRPLQLPDPLADQSRGDHHDSCAITNNSYILLDWRLAAGSTVCVKTSGFLPSTNPLLAELFSQCLDQDCYRVVAGANIPISTRLLELQQNHSQ